MRLKFATGKPEDQVAAGRLLRVVADVVERPLEDVEAAGDVAIEQVRLGERELIVLRPIARRHLHGQALAAAHEVRRLERQLAEHALVLRHAGAEGELIAVLLRQLHRHVDGVRPGAVFLSIFVSRSSPWISVK